MQFAFQHQQFDRLFPFYITIGSDCRIVSFGSSYQSLLSMQAGESITNYLAFKRPSVQIIHAAALASMKGQLILMQGVQKPSVLLRGQFEHLAEKDQWLFIGTPWFASVEELREAGLTINNFAVHDPLIDLLHVLKAHELTEQDLKQMLHKVQLQQLAIEDAGKQMNELSLFTKHNPEPRFRVSSKGLVLLKNPAAQRLHQYLYNDELMNEAVFWQQVAALRPTNDMRWTVETVTEGKIFVFDCHFFPEFDYFHVYGTDVTQQRNMAADLQRREQLFKRLADNVPGVVYLWRMNFDGSNNVEFISPRLQEEFGINPADANRLVDFIHPDDLPVWQESVRGAFHEEAPWNADCRFVMPNGELIYWTANARVAYTDAQGKVFAGVMRNTTEEKTVLENLKRLSVVASANENGVVFANKFGQITWANDGFLKMTGFEMSQVVGKSPIDLCAGPQTDKQALREMVFAFEQGQSFDVEVLQYRNDGTHFMSRTRGQSVLNSEGGVLEYFAIVEDITKAKEDEARIRYAEQLWKFALEGAGDGVWQYDLETHQSFYSEEYKRMLGYDPATFDKENQFWLNRIHPDDLTTVVKENEEYDAGTRSSHNREIRMRHKDGHYLWILDRGMAVSYTANGLPKLVTGTHTNISHIKNTELELWQRVQQFQSLSEGIPAVLYEYEYAQDGTEKLRYVSPAMQRIFGISPEAFREDYRRFVFHEDLPAIDAANEASLSSLKPYYNESRLQLPNGKLVWRSVAATYSYDTAAGAHVFTGFMMDITDRKKAEDALRLNEEKYRGIIANMNLGLLEVDIDDRIQVCNQSFLRMSGYAQHEITGKRAVDLFVDTDEKYTIELQNRRRSAGHSDVYEMKVHNKQGEEKWWLISGAPRYDDSGKMVGSIGIHLDITQQKLLEQELRMATLTAEESSRAKERFLANMSHEMRTPMNAIIGLGRQLKKTQLDQQQRLFLDSINTASDNLLVIINDVLDLSKIQAGKLALEHIPFKPAELVRRAVQMIMHRVEEKNLWVEVKMEEGIAPVLIGDPYRLQQILINLVSNAVKFTDHGGITITLAAKPQTIHGQCFIVTVQDTGIGIDEAFVQEMFEPFSQAYTHSTRKYGGTGLGLSIIKQLVDLMHGDIEVQSTTGHGTTFTIKVMLEQGTESDLPKETSHLLPNDLLKNISVLLVEDNAMNRLVARTVLQQYGASVVEAVHGEDAIHLLQKETVDIVLMDMQMPVLDGVSATAIIRKDISSSLPVIALTANALSSEQDACFKAGMNDFVAKPFEENVLIRKIAEWVGRPFDEQAAAQPVVATSSAESDLPLYSLDMLNDIARGNQAFVQKMVDMFVEQTPAIADQLLAHANHGEWEQMGAVAHKLKPTLDNLGFTSLHDDIRTIEKSGKLAEVNDDVLRMVNKVHATIHKVIGILSANRKD